MELTSDERQGRPSASAFYRYQLCPASFIAEQGARRLGQVAYQDSEAASAGERIHAALAQRAFGPALELCDPEEQRSVDLLCERALGEVNRIFGQGKELTVLAEHRLWFRKHALSGRIDRLYHDQDTALVQDFKTGYHEPEPAHINAQLMVLSVLVALHLPHLEQVIAQIVTGPYGISEARYGMAELSCAYEEIKATLKAIEDPLSPYRPSPRACRYCPAVLICPAYAQMRKELKPQELPPPERAEALLNACELLSRQTEQIRAYYRELLARDSALEIPGWALVPGPSRREVGDWRAARAKLEEFVSADELDALADYSIPRLEKLLCKSLGISPRGVGKKLAQILGEHLSVRPGNLVLKRTKEE